MFWMVDITSSFFDQEQPGAEGIYCAMGVYLLSAKARDRRTLVPALFLLEGGLGRGT